MAGARQLLLELLRERRASFSSSSRLIFPVADSSRGPYQNDPLHPCNQRVLNFQRVTNDEEDGFPPPGLSKVLPRTFSGDLCRSSTTSAFGTLSQIRAVGAPRHTCFNGYGPALLGRHCSTVSGTQLEGELGGLGGKVEGLDVATADVAGKLASPEAQAVNEVSAIIGDCSYPTAFVQILMDSMHTSLGLPWWAAIAATTICIRLLCLPIVAYQMKSSAKLSLMRPKMEKINERIKASNYDPNVSSEGRDQIFALFKEYKTTPLSPFLGAVLQAPVFLSFFFAIQNMCERLEPFKHGGFLLFTDLSAKDSTYILPLTLSAVMLLSVEINALEGMEGNPYAANMKKFFRVFALVLFPVSLNFETALFFYWIPSNFFSILQAYIFRQKAVKEFMGIPSTEHLATSSTNVTPVEPALPDTRTINPVKKKLAFGRGKSKGHGRR